MSLKNVFVVALLMLVAKHKTKVGGLEDGGGYGYCLDIQEDLQYCLFELVEFLLQHAIITDKCCRDVSYVTDETMCGTYGILARYGFAAEEEKRITRHCAAQLAAHASITYHPTSPPSPDDDHPLPTPTHSPLTNLPPPSPDDDRPAQAPLTNLPPPSPDDDRPAQAPRSDPTPPPSPPDAFPADPTPPPSPPDAFPADPTPPPSPPDERPLPYNPSLNDSSPRTCDPPFSDDHIPHGPPSAQ